MQSDKASGCLRILQNIFISSHTFTLSCVFWDPSRMAAVPHLRASFNTLLTLVTLWILSTSSELKLLKTQFWPKFYFSGKTVLSIGPLACIHTNDVQCMYCLLQRGIWQGCPLSLSFFNLHWLIDPYASSLRQSHAWEGIIQEDALYR